MNGPPSYHIKKATCRQSFWTKDKQMQQQPFARRYASEKLKPSNQFILFYEAPRSMLKALVADIQSHFSVHTLSPSHAERLSVCLSCAQSLSFLQRHTHFLTLASWVRIEDIHLYALIAYIFSFISQFIYNK